MLTCYLLNRSGKRRIATQPLIGYNSQGILIAGRTWFTPQLLRRDVDDGISGFLRLLSLLRTCALGNDGNAKFGEQDLVVPPKQHTLRFDVAMYQFLRMDIVQRPCHLLDVRDNDV